MPKKSKTVRAEEAAAAAAAAAEAKAEETEPAAEAAVEEPPADAAATEEAKEGETAAEEAEDASGDEAEPGVEEGDGEEVWAGPTHEPFSLNVLSAVKTQQNSNGLRHNDHLRYRQYCSRRLRRLYVVLRFKHGRGRYKHAVFPKDFENQKFLEIPLTQAERCWSFGLQLKADNATASAFNPQWRHHSINRLHKAVKWGNMLVEVCKIHCDQRTQLEAEAYASSLEGTYLVEKEQWAEALEKLVRCKRVCEQLGLVSGQTENALYKAKVAELAPSIRECKYNLGEGYDDENTNTESGAATTSGRKDEFKELNYRGQGLSIVSEKLRAQLLKCLRLVSDIGAGGAEESTDVIEKYGEVAAEFGDALKEIHSDMIAAGNEGQSAAWRDLEAFARELSICMNVERNLVLLWNHLAKLDGLTEVCSMESRKACRPEEGMRYCDLLKADIADLKELPETSEAISETLAGYSVVVQNGRALFLALCHQSQGKLLEAAALMDMLGPRVSEVDLGKPQPEPMGRLHRLVERVQDGMPARVARWRCRGLAQLCESTGKLGTAARKEKVVGDGAAQKPPDEFRVVGEPFPPRFRDIPCKPLLFDLAFPCITQPDLSDFGKKGAGDAKGLFHRAATGLGNRLGGFWGRK